MRPADSSDMKWLKAAKKFAGEEIEDTFDEYMIRTFAQYQEVMMLEDRNAKFSAGFGPVGIVAALTNGHLYQPHVEWFPWATARNKLRSAVMFFQKSRYRDLAIVRVHALDGAAPFYRRMKQYVPLYFAAKIPGGDEFGRGDDHIFYMKCRGTNE